MPRAPRIRGARVEHELVRHHAARAAEQHAVVRREALRHVVRVQDRQLRGALQAGRAHHRDVHPRDRQDARATVCCRRYRLNGMLSATAVDGMRRQERREVRSHRDRTHAGTAAAVRDAKRLVQVQVADIGAEVARPAQPHLRVHVRAVQVDLTAARVDELADLLDLLLEHAMRRRVRDHQ
jgi:hypothetical protein